MLRDRSHLACFALAAALLGGCSITIGGARTAQPAPQGQPAAQPAARPGPQARTPAPPPRRRRPPPATAARLTDPIAFGNGKEGAFQGLAYVVPENTQRMPPYSRLVPFATLYTDSFNVADQEFTSGFPGALVQNEWFLLHYEGEFSVPSTGNYQLRVVSDDGAVLYIDDKKVVDNDGVHTAKTADGQASLTAGPHWLRLDYFQAERGRVALMVLIGQNNRLNPLVGTR